MQQVFEHIQYLVGDRAILEGMESVPVLPLFSDAVLDFLDALSGRLIRNKRARACPDVIAYAFWIRKASMGMECVPYKTAVQRMGRGVVFQIAPSNIPVQFAISMTYALASGNASIVRVSQRDFEQVEIICEAIRDVITNSYPEMAPYICIVRYEHNENITKMLTDLCDVRMIWGGDRTIAMLRQVPVKPRCIDLGFSDRYSVAVINSDEYLEMDAVVLANNFYNDTYFVDQNACSSPRLVLWTGQRIPEAKERFWDELHKLVLEKFEMEPICSSEKLLKTAICAAKYPGVREIKEDNFLVRIELPVLCDDIMEYKGKCGYFFECDIETLQEMVPILKKECQTVTYIGGLEQKIRDVVQEFGVRGVDRIVPVGRGTHISFVWDGMDIPNVLSRQIGNS